MLFNICWGIWLGIKGILGRETIFEVCIFFLCWSRLNWTFCILCQYSQYFDMLWVYIVVEVFRIEQKGTIQLYEIVPQGRSAFDRSNSSIIRWHRVNVRTHRGRRVEEQKKKKSIFAWSGRAAVLVIENFNIFCCKTSGNNNPPPRNNFSSLTPLFIFHSSMLLPVSLRSFTFFVYAEFRYVSCVFFFFHFCLFRCVFVYLCEYTVRRVLLLFVGRKMRNELVIDYTALFCRRFCHAQWMENPDGNLSASGLE